MLPFLYQNSIDKEETEILFLNLVTRLKLDNLMSQRCKSLSGGEKQRVSLARALIHNPDILICDEPTGNLDKDNLEIVMNILEEEKKKGKTIIVVTHSLEVANKADRILFLKKGVLVDEKSI